MVSPRLFFVHYFASALNTWLVLRQGATPAWPRHPVGCAERKCRLREPPLCRNTFYFNIDNLSLFRHHHSVLNENLPLAFIPPLVIKTCVPLPTPIFTAPLHQMYSQQEYLQQAKSLSKESSDPEGGGTLPLACTSPDSTYLKCYRWRWTAAQPVVEQDAELAEEADKYTKVKIYLEDRAVEISNYLEVVSFRCMWKCWNTFVTPFFLARRS